MSEKRKVGRPPSRYEPTRLVTGQITHPVFDALNAYCKKGDLVRHSVVERAIIEFLERESGR